ncbi:pyruvate kinase [Carboxylicivirga sp. M1479]|uniref:pyruvate kinase n=1 Tax=Carboxylicivirga sp. M1479 TaxID=2594476 RepID=UPI0011774C8E|nr:pyruvate kinase [Carboxylicivirga sp. M1479]TRX66366.1 pyruvate kinase [Carboxylicivirga sp. M1479]
MKKFTKIVATISDRSCDVDFLKKLYKSGMNVVRLNTAHQDYEGVLKVITNVRAVSDKIAILIDTKGPEIRTTKCEDDIELTTGDVLKVKGDINCLSSKECICVSYEHFVKDMPIGGQILIDDGEVAMEVTAKEDDYLTCKVLNDGIVGSRKSVNIPGVRVSLPSVTEKDRNFIKFAAQNNIDFVAHSFVRNKEDVIEVQQILNEMESPMKIVAKIENEEGVANLDEILEHVHGIMVARGDLGIEIPQEKIPGIQRRMIRKCVEAKKPVIVATQMLHTMIKNPRPTRAEVTDVANAIYYRTDAIMLSGETAYGNYPVEAVKTMAKIAKEVEASKDSRYDIPVLQDTNDITAYLSDTAVRASKNLDIKAVLTDSLTGKTARYLAAFRGAVPVYALCYNQNVGRQLALSYGVSPRLMEDGSSKKEILKKTLKKLLKKEVLVEDDLVAYLGGSFGIGGGTTYLEVITVKALLKKVDKD